MSGHVIFVSGYRISTTGNQSNFKQDLRWTTTESTLKVISHGKASPVMVNYARNWQKLVGEELRAEINDGLLKRPRGMEVTITVLGPVKDAKMPGVIWVAATPLYTVIR